MRDKFNQNVRYQILMNQDTFTYIVNNGIYNVNGQEAMAQANKPTDFPGERVRAQDIVDLDRHGPEDLQPAQRQILHRQRLLRAGRRQRQTERSLQSRPRRALRHAHHFKAGAAMVLDHVPERL